jgi:hypothetical protein
MTWVVVGCAVLLGVTVAAMFALAGRKGTASSPPAGQPDHRCCRTIVVTRAAPSRDVWAPEDWLG